MHGLIANLIYIPFRGILGHRMVHTHDYVMFRGRSCGLVLPSLSRSSALREPFPQIRGDGLSGSRYFPFPSQMSHRDIPLCGLSGPWDKFSRGEDFSGSFCWSGVSVGGSLVANSRDSALPPGLSGGPAEVLTPPPSAPGQRSWRRPDP